MKTVPITENGLCLQFIVTDEGFLCLTAAGPGGGSSRPAEKPDPAVHALVEVQSTGSGTTRHSGGKHYGHACPDIPRYVSHTDSKNDKGRELVFTLKSGQLEIRQHIQLYDGIPALSAFAEVENITDSPVGLEYLSSLRIAGIGRDSGGSLPDKLELFIPHNHWCRELNWQSMTLRRAGYLPISTAESTGRIAYSNTGTWSAKDTLPMGALTDHEAGETVLWQIESNGSWGWEISDAARELYLILSGPSEAENGWFKELAPGESFRSVPAALTFVKGDFNEAVRAMTAYRRKIVDPGRIDTALPVIFNDYMQCLNANPTIENELPTIDAAAALGCEIYCMDAGWYAPGSWWDLVGEWEVSTERFHGDMKPIFDRIREHGMVPGIWLEPEVMGVNCPLVGKFRDCFFMRHGRPVITRGRYQLDFRHPKVIAHLDGVIDRLTRDYGIGYFKFDYNIEPGIGTECDADSFGDGLLSHNRAFLAWIDSLYARHPGLQIENCASGGMRMEYGSLKHFAIQSLSDASLYPEFAYMSAMAPSGVIPEQAGIWVVPKVSQTPGEIAFTAVNGMLSRMYVSGETAKLDSEKFALLKEAVDCYKSYRADLVSSLPDLPDGICHYTDVWTAAGRISGDGRRYYMTVGRRTGGDSSRTFPLPAAFDAAGTRILYAAPGTGEIRAEGGQITVTLPENSGILIAADAK